MTKPSSTLKKPKVIVAIIAASATIIVGYFQFVWKPSHPHAIQQEYAGRVLDATTQSAISNAKISLDLPSLVPQIAYSDTEGVFLFSLALTEDQTPGQIRVEADGYEIYSRNISLASKTLKIADIRLVRSPAPNNTTAPAEPSSAPTPTDTPTLTPTSLPTSTYTPTPPSSAIRDGKGVEMILVPAGGFIFGYDKGTDVEKPQGTRILDAFYIDKYEVTNRLYADCVKAKSCQQPHHLNSATRQSYYGDPTYDDYPVIYVDWFMANAYCAWRGGRLPTEPEWEKAARGSDGRLYPWGNDLDYQLANYGNNVGDTQKVGSYQRGRSRYGVYDMAGNVAEWVSSVFMYYPYKTSDGREDPNNVLDPRITRGGDWRSSSGAELRTSYRKGFFLYYDGKPVSLDYVGFRCARSIAP